MKILYFYQYFSTPKGAWGTRVYDFAKNWVEQGHEVTVVTSIYAKSDIAAKKLVSHQQFDGIQVVVLNVLVDNKQSFLRRILSFIQYSVLSTWYALTLPADVVVASSGPITVGIPGLAARYLRGRKLVFETRDLWPEGAIQLGIIKNSLLKKIARRFESACYRAASHVVALSPGMKQEIAKKTGIRKVTSVTNSANIELFGTPSGKMLPASLAGKSFAIYTGNIGEVNNSRWLLEAAKMLKSKNREDILILLVGEGQLRQELEKEARDCKLNNFIVLGLMPKTDLVAYIQQAMVSVVPLKGVPVLDSSSPNKFFESLAAGVPVVQNTRGWMKDYLERHEVGFTLDPDDAASLAELLIELDRKPAFVKEMGARAKTLAARHFDTNYLADKMLNVLLEVHRGASAGKPEIMEKKTLLEQV